jgi:hypothetical protein
MASVRNSCVWSSRAVLLALALEVTACSASTSSVAPSAMLNMSSLPDDQDRRRERIESTEVRRGPENRKPLPTKLRRVETAAATAAAIVGMFFSSSPSVLLGGGIAIDEGPVFQSGESRGKDGRRKDGKRAGKSGDKGKDGEASDDGASEDEASDDETIDATQLVPWVRLPAAEPAP